MVKTDSVKEANNEHEYDHDHDHDHNEHHGGYSPPGHHEIGKIQHVKYLIEIRGE
jgi:hypothetical protein